MYTGIVTHKLPIFEIIEYSGLHKYIFLFPEDLLDGFSSGASVSVSGVCLTVVSIEDNFVSFDVMQETLNKIAPIGKDEGQEVNILRPARIGEENGGHNMYGHVIGTAEIVYIKKFDNNCVMTFEVKKEWMKYILQKGFVGLDGCSLTVTDPDEDASTFKIWFIPETLRKTTFGKKKIGDLVNVELDHQTQTIVDTVERVLIERFV